MKIDTAAAVMAIGLRSAAATRFPRFAMKPQTQSGGDSMRVAVASEEEEDESLVTDSANVRKTCGFDILSLPCASGLAYATDDRLQSERYPWTL